eukprot:350341-Chlamydomonas_euryale.AAC.3
MAPTVGIHRNIVHTFSNTHYPEAGHGRLKEVYQGMIRRRLRHMSLLCVEPVKKLGRLCLLQNFCTEVAVGVQAGCSSRSTAYVPMQIQQGVQARCSCSNASAPVQEDDLQSRKA